MGYWWLISNSTLSVFQCQISFCCWGSLIYNSTTSPFTILTWIMYYLLLNWNIICSMISFFYRNHLHYRLYYLFRLILCNMLNCIIINNCFLNWNLLNNFSILIFYNYSLSRNSFYALSSLYLCYLSLKWYILNTTTTIWSSSTNL